MDANETVYARWIVGRDQVIFIAAASVLVIFSLFAFSLWSIYFVSRSTNLIFLVIPILLLFLLLASVPEFFKSLRSVPENSEVYLTDKGVYRRKLRNKEDYKFIPWEQMSGYDMCYLSSNTLLGKFFVRPTQFFLKSKYEEDNFAIEAFGEDVEVLRAYLKENNVPFGFLKKA